ncbi:MAG: hypothetical protein AAGA36_03160 [Pseudomonadota bacterium]
MRIFLILTRACGSASAALCASMPCLMLCITAPRAAQAQQPDATIIKVVNRSKGVTAYQPTPTTLGTTRPRTQTRKRRPPAAPAPPRRGFSFAPDNARGITPKPTGGDTYQSWGVDQLTRYLTP